MEIVKWYIEVIEGGFDTKTILPDFLAANREIKTLKFIFTFSGRGSRDFQ